MAIRADGQPQQIGGNGGGQVEVSGGRRAYQVHHRFCQHLLGVLRTLCLLGQSGVGGVGRPLLPEVARGPTATLLIKLLRVRRSIVHTTMTPEEDPHCEWRCDDRVAPSSAGCTGLLLPALDHAAVRPQGQEWLTAALEEERTCGSRCTPPHTRARGNPDGIRAAGKPRC